MSDYYYDIKKYAMTLGLTTGTLWLIGGVLGVYFSKKSPSLFLSAIVVGGVPILTTLAASRFNIIGALALIAEAILMLLVTYSEIGNLFIIVILLLSYSLPMALSGAAFMEYWYKNKTRI